MISHLGNDFPFQAKQKALRYTKDKRANPSENNLTLLLYSQDMIYDTECPEWPCRCHSPGVSSTLFAGKWEIILLAFIWLQIEML